MTDSCDGPFEREGGDFSALCACTPDLASALARVRRNQELYLEYQQKCLNQFDPTRQQAIEHAGDIIRELSKPGFDMSYLGEKITRLEKRMEDFALERRQGRRSWTGELKRLD